MCFLGVNQDCYSLACPIRDSRVGAFVTSQVLILDTTSCQQWGSRAVNPNLYRCLDSYGRGMPPRALVDPSSRTVSENIILAPREELGMNTSRYRTSLVFASQRMVLISTFTLAPTSWSTGASKALLIRKARTLLEWDGSGAVVHFPGTA